MSAPAALHLLLTVIPQGAGIIWPRVLRRGSDQQECAQLSSIQEKFISGPPVHSPERVDTQRQSEGMRLCVLSRPFS